MKSSRTAIVVLATVALFRADALLGQPTWEIGFKGGLNTSKVFGDDVPDLVTADLPGVGTVSGDFGSWKAGFVGGAFVQAHLTDAFGVRVEGLFNAKGGKGDISGTVNVPGFGDVDFSGEVTLALTYVEIPVLAVYSMRAGEFVTVYGAAGPAFAFNTDAEVEIDLGLGGSESVGVDEFVRGFDFGGVLGGGVSFAAGRLNILVDGRWTFGFGSIDDGFIPGVDAEVKNSALSFTAGLGIPVGG